MNWQIEWDADGRPIRLWWLGPDPAAPPRPRPVLRRSAPTPPPEPPTPERGLLRLLEAQEP